MVTLRQQLQVTRTLRRLRTWAPPVSIGVIVGAGAFLVAERLKPAPPSPEPAVFERRETRPVLIEAARPTPSRPYSNCDAARAAGTAPLRAGEPGYGPHLDADRDGVACEPSLGR